MSKSESPKKVKVYSIDEIAESALANRKQLYSKGYSCGFHSGDHLISYKKGYTTGIFSYSAQGKTQFYIEESVWLSLKYGLKHAVWLSESGKKEEVVLDIVMCYKGKKLFGEGEVLTDEEIIDGMNWLKDYFFIIDHEEEQLNIRDIYIAVKSIETKYNVKIDCIGVDNASNLGKEDIAAKMSVVDYMKYLMKAINRTSLKHDYHTFLLMHVNDTDPIECSVTKRKYLPRPTHWRVSGGQQVNFLGFQLIGVWRPVSQPDEYGIVNPSTGAPFELNEGHIEITKSKPKMIGALGRFVLYFDKERQMYYEVIDGNKYYRGEYEQQFHSDRVVEEKKFVMPTSNLDQWIQPTKESEIDFDNPF